MCCSVRNSWLHVPDFVERCFFSLGHSSGSEEHGANTTSGPMRKPQIPGEF